MSKVVQWKRGNTSATTSYTGYEGEITVNTDTWNLHVHDGYTPGGWIIDSSNSGGEFGNLSAGNVAVTSAITTDTLVATGNVTANYFIGNGSLLTGISSYSDADVATYLSSGNVTSNIITTGNIAANNVTVTNDINISGSGDIVMTNGKINTSRIQSRTDQGQDLWLEGETVVTIRTSEGDNDYDWTFQIDGSLRWPNGSTQTTAYTGYDNANVVAYSEAGFAGNIIPSANVTYTLGNATNQWASLYVSGNTIYLDNTPLSISGNMLTLNGSNISDHIYVDDSVTTANTNMKSYVDSTLTGYPTTSEINSAISSNLTTAQTYTDNSIANLIASAPSTLDTLNEIATALGNDPNLSATLTTLIGNVSSNVSAIQADYANITLLNSTVSANLTTAQTYTDTANTNMKSYVDGEILAIGVHYNNGDVANLLASFGSNTIVTTGNISTGNIIVTGNVIPSANVTYSLGTADDQWKELWVSGNTIYIGGVPLSVIGDDISIRGNALARDNQLSTVATSGNYSDLSGKPTIPSLGNFTVTDNTIQTSNGVGGITLSIFGADAADPPSLVMKEWVFGNTGVLTAPNGLTITSGNVTATGAVLSGNATVGNLLVNRNIYAQAISTSAGITGYAITSNNTITATGNATVGGILTDNYYFANGTPFTSSNYGNAEVAAYLPTYTGNITAGNILTDNYFYANGDPFIAGSDYSDSNVVTLLSSFGSNDIVTTGNITASYMVGDGSLLTNVSVNVAGNIVGTEDNVTIISNGYEWTFDTAGNLTLPGNVFAINYANGTIAGGGLTDLISDTSPQLGGNLDLNEFEINGLGNINTGGFIRVTAAGGGSELLLNEGMLSSGNGTNNLILSPSDGNVWITLPNSISEDGNALEIAHENQDNGAIFLKSGQSYVRWYANAVLEVNGNITAGNILTDNYFYANGDPFVAGSNYSDSNVVTLLSSFGSNSIVTTGNVTTDVITANTANVAGTVQATDLSLSGNITGSSANVTITANSYVTTFDTTGLVSFPGSVSVAGDVEVTGNSSSLVRKISGLVDAGTYLELDNIKVSVTTTGNRGLSLGAVTTTYIANVGGHYMTATGGDASSANDVTYTTTPSGTAFGWNFVAQGDTSVYNIFDKTNTRMYRVTLMIGASYLNNFFSIERLL